MKKLKLNAEALKVESFASDDTTPQRGTVKAHSDLCSGDCTQDMHCTYYRDCYTERDDCTPQCTQGGWTCGWGC